MSAATAWTALGTTGTRRTGARPSLHAVSRPVRRARHQASYWAQRGVVGSLLAATILVVTLSVALSPARPEAQGWTTVEVGANSTLWELAREHPIPGLDTRTTVDRIQARNGLVSPTLMPGQSVLVPDRPPSGVTVASR